MYKHSHVSYAPIAVGSIIRADMAGTFLEVIAAVPFLPGYFVVQSYATRKSKGRGTASDGTIRLVQYKRKPRLMHTVYSVPSYCEVQSFTNSWNTWGYCHVTLTA